MTTSHKKFDTEIYYSDTDAGTDDTTDNLTGVTANKKISRFYLECSEVSLDAIWAFQYRDRDVYYIDHNKLVNDRLTHSPNQDLILHQFDIPAADEEQQKRISELYKKTKGCNQDAHAFGSNEETKPSLVAQFKYYSGYWQYSKKNNDIVFHRCDENEKIKFLNHVKHIANKTTRLTYEVVKLEENIKQKQKYCGLSIAFAIAAIAFKPSVVLLGEVLLLLQQYYSYQQNVGEIRKRLDCINQSDGLFVHSLFSQQNKTPDITAQINDLKKIYEPK